jgi:hypothetical protein
MLVPEMSGDFGWTDSAACLSRSSSYMQPRGLQQLLSAVEWDAAVSAAAVGLVGRSSSSIWQGGYYSGLVPPLPPPPPPPQQQQQQQQDQWLLLPQLTVPQQMEVREWLYYVSMMMKVDNPPKNISTRVLEAMAPPPYCIYEVFGGVGGFAAQAPGVWCCGGFVSLNPVFHKQLQDEALAMGWDTAACAGNKSKKQ